MDTRAVYKKEGYISPLENYGYGTLSLVQELLKPGVDTCIENFGCKYQTLLHFYNKYNVSNITTDCCASSFRSV